MSEETTTGLFWGCVVGVVISGIFFMSIDHFSDYHWVHSPDTTKRLPDGAHVRSIFDHNWTGLVVRHTTAADCPNPQPHQVVVISGPPRTVNILEEVELEICPEK